MTYHLILTLYLPLFYLPLLYLPLLYLPLLYLSVLNLSILYLPSLYIHIMYLPLVLTSLTLTYPVLILYLPILYLLILFLLFYICRYDLLPFYSRLVATLHPCMPDVSAELCKFLLLDFRFLVKKKDQIKIESKIKTVRFMGE